MCHPLAQPLAELQQPMAALLPSRRMRDPAFFAIDALLHRLPVFVSPFRAHRDGPL